MMEYPEALSEVGLAVEDDAPVAAEIEVTEATEETVRTYFPETWIWELVSVG